MSIASVFVSVEPLRRQKDTDCFVRVFCLVGVARLELAALRSRTVRATKLRYTPINMCFVSICCGAFGSASRISVRSCALNNSFGDMFLFWSIPHSIRSTFRKPNCATPRYLVVVNFDCLCNIHQFEHFCNKNKSIILKIMFYAIIFLSR